MQSKEEEKASFYDYRRNSRAHEPTGDFVYPMGLPAIARFEILTEVQVNVFRLIEVLINFVLIGVKLYLSTSEEMVGCTFVEELVL